MQFDVRMPEYDQQISELRLERWVLVVGDEIQPNGILCELKPLSRQSLNRQPTHRGILARLRGEVRQRSVSADEAPTISVIASESGVISQIVTDAGSRVDADDVIARVEIGSDPGEGGYFNVVAEIVRADFGSTI